MKTLIPIKINQ